MQELACFTFLTSSNHEISASAAKGGTSTNAGCSTIKTPQDPQISPNKNLGVVGCETPHFQRDGVSTVKLFLEKMPAEIFFPSSVQVKHSRNVYIKKKAHSERKQIISLVILPSNPTLCPIISGESHRFQGHVISPTPSSR